jgi:DNA-directed RNA polymerase subunit beta'
VREWSHGAIRSAADLDSEKIFGPLRSYACHCGRFLGNRYRGIVCHKCGVEVISRASRAVRPAHLQLPRPVVHPWYVPVVAQVLELAQPAVKAADSELLRDRLRDVDIRWSAERLRNTLADPIGARRRAEATARLELLDALVGATIRPEWFVLELVPVWPPEAELPPPLESAALRTCYVDILEPPDLAQAVRRLFNYVGRQAKAAS